MLMFREGTYKTVIIQHVISAINKMETTSGILGIFHELQNAASGSQQKLAAGGNG